eukprot:TRINITY_DN53925_c0_g1_i1.p1 TRINITY_DN53925_c0_g1~~TRINITY_DN53925_c0_g1_i1.p1  ORF type:complete len:216 (+),score=22.41 TRINITY_DN53925_c0_g1_i1:57-704(+)
MFEDLIKAGIDTNVSEPAFYTSLFSFCAKLELAPICLALFHSTLDINCIIHTSENMLANMVNICFHRIETGESDPETNDNCVMDKRYFSAKPQNKWEMWSSLLKLPDRLVLVAMSFCNHQDLWRLGLTCVKFYFMSLSHFLWSGLVDSLKTDFKIALSDHLMSSKLVYKTYYKQFAPHLYIRTDEGEMTCLFTGDVVKTDKAADKKQSAPGAESH